MHLRLIFLHKLHHPQLPLPSSNRLLQAPKRAFVKLARVLAEQSLSNLVGHRNVTGNEQAHQVALRSTEAGRHPMKTKLLKAVAISKAESPTSRRELLVGSSTDVLTKLHN